MNQAGRPPFDLEVNLRSLTNHPAQAIFLLAIISLVVYAVGYVVYQVWLHPLANFPGPFLGKFTEWNTILPSVRGESTRTRHAWSLEYGDVVRIGPNELLFGGIESVKDIYGQTSNPCLKDPDFYRGFTVTGANNVLNAMERVEHARIRRLLSHAFAMAEIKKTQPRLIPIMERGLDVIESSPQPVNVYDPLNHMFLDVVSELSFDKCFNNLQGECIREAKYADDVQNISALRGMFPFVEWLPTTYVQDAVKARPRLIQFARSRIEDFRARLEKGKVKEGSLLKRVVESKDERTGEPLTDLELMENAIIFIQAGSETSLSTLLYLLYEVDTHPDIKARLVKEIREAVPNKHAFPLFETVEQLTQKNLTQPVPSSQPFLNNVLEETLRLHGPIPVNLPRISPGKMIGGHYVPAGTRVCNLAYTTHRNPEIFPDPDSFVPDRWDNVTTEMKLAYRPFSTGPRNCIGLHLARLQIILMVSALYARYDLQLDKSVTPEMMIAADRGVMSPNAKTVTFHVKPRADS
ncbi:hypothetical protein LTR10_021976 [Elasticomyces elasticus]|uniref:Cytochrome P450 n=1 Tax=Exophiala sideris TaxID=1016849 RepID=A0ABR0JD06_9EURO|nr:hypothetical protein LTR10_021976 [Elasticomyces elasticus]KAK5030659.1 hypothetical protein LTS07_005443 [Exophiala sideris]KAK5038713.1 hypothetical protein LTR13_004460 [Exophiala sideris]KAK5060594.1 hypothetical protein LTR69_005911 [Exophiala sideris]KAK5183506.1 hypothetical protein LTR44_004507 [Eurotiomycetes sp. CCFEE 6388]